MTQDDHARVGESARAPKRADITACGIILAAGRSTRLGRPKQLLPLGGRPLLQHVVDAACASQLDHVLIVLGPRAADVAAALAPGRAQVVVNHRFAEGQSTSLHCGIGALEGTVGPHGRCGALFLLGDQPGVTSQIIDSVVGVYLSGKARIVAPRYIDGPGNPVLFDRDLWPELRRVVGDEGARGVLRARRSEVVEVPISTERLDDVDTWDDYQRLVGRLTSSHASPAEMR